MRTPTPEEIRRVREERGFTQAELAEELGNILGTIVSNVTISRWERGHRDPSGPWRVALVRWLESDREKDSRR